MILSFHPCYEADLNILCAGRAPDGNDRDAIRAADAVVLPQGCRESLYAMARDNCGHVFPNYDARFRYPGKTGQARLFQELKAPCPRTWVFADTLDFQRNGATVREAGLPLVFKLDWGGEGDTVMPLRSAGDLERALSRAALFERSGHNGFVLQEMVSCGNRSLRVAVIGRYRKAYWRVQDDAAIFGTSLAKGARADSASDPELTQKALVLTDRFCRQASIDLAGIDLLFDSTPPGTADGQPLILEVNYFFGRTGLGGSERFYKILKTELDGWLARLGLAVRRTASIRED